MALRDLQEQLAEQEQEQEDTDIDIEVVDDRPPQDRRDPVDLDELDDDDDLTDEEIEALGSRAEKRIKKLTFKFNEARRQAEQAQRERQEAFEAARRMKEITDAREMEYRKALIQRQQAIVNTGVRDSRAALAQAMQSGDPDEIAEAQANLTRALMAEGEMRRVSQAPPQDPIQQRAERQPSPKAAEWAQRNPWFNQNRPMTAYAYGVHEDLIMSGVEVESDAYYAAIDKAMKDRFPEAFGKSGGSERPRADSGDTVSVDISPSPRRTTPVAPTGRTNATTSRSNGKVKLTRTQVETAKALGVPLKEYARQLLAMERNNG